MSNFRDSKTIEAELDVSTSWRSAFERETERLVRELRNARYQHAQRRDIDLMIGGLKQELRAAKDSEAITGAHPFVGKRLKRISITYPYRSSWRNGRQVQVEIYGIGETVTSETRFPANMASYSTPRVGSTIVRLFKKDGTLGSKFEVLTDVPVTIHGRAVTDEERASYWSEVK